MKIAIDARALSHPQPGGFKTYTSRLIHALIAEYQEDDYFLYLDRTVDDPVLASNQRVIPKIVPPIGGWIGVPLREQIYLPWKLRQVAPDVVHFPCATGSLLSRYPSVVTIHDAIEFLDPPHLSRPLIQGLRRIAMSQYNRAIQRVMATRANAIITVSAYSQRDLATVLNIPESKFVVVPEAPAPSFKPAPVEQISSWCKQHHLPSSFILALVSASPRKNVLGLLHVYAQIPQSLRAQYPLVLVWTHSLLRTQIDQEIARLQISTCVHSLTSVSDEDLVFLYNAASLFVFPSLYEGFGLPVLEAMACGTPVVASNLTSIPEVTGDAAVLVDPRDQSQFTRILVDVLNSTTERQKLSAASLARAQTFSWQRTAQMTRDVYSRVAMKRHR